MATNEHFITLFENVFDREFCNSFINYYNWCEEAGLTEPRLNERKHDNAICVENTIIDSPSEITFSVDNGGTLVRKFQDVFWERYKNSIVPLFPQLEMMQESAIFCHKVQKTSPGQGYHVWHTEVDGVLPSKRWAVYTVYLNDVEEGGETEFLYQAIRVKPKMGSLMFWPAGWTHPHRGNPPLSGDKYILTGWVEFR